MKPLPEIARPFRPTRWLLFYLAMLLADAAVIGIRDWCRAVHREFGPGAGNDSVAELRDKWEADVFKETDAT